MKINRIDIIVISIAAVLGVYLIVQAPPPLERADAEKGEKIPVEQLFKIVAEENAVVRTQWTKQIVGPGKKAGIKFGENWKKRGVEQGPLPALFLREVALNLEKKEVPLGLFLGSDYPISKANKFEGDQTVYFEKIKTTGEPQFFFDESTARYTAMFADIASSKACVTCHNEHKDTPKNDWVLFDIMGATTWTYPKEYVTRDEIALVINGLRESIRTTYNAFVLKAESFDSPPVIADKWPEEGYFVPRSDVFIDRFKQSVSSHTLGYLIEPQIPSGSTTAN